MRCITEVDDLENKFVIVRSSGNVPIIDGQVTNIYRLKRSLATLSFLSKQGAKVIVIAHIGRELSDTLLPVFEAFNKLIPMRWGGLIGSPEFKSARASLQSGEILLAENLRQDPREIENDKNFAQELADLADIYVNDAFDNIHRQHTSMVTLPTLLPSFAGINLMAEITELEKARQPISPSLFILGGAKFETKMPLVEKYLELYDHVFVTGALLNDILKARGDEIGTSLISDVSLVGASFLDNPKLLPAIDVIVESSRGTRIASIHDISSDEKIIDMGPATLESLLPLVNKAKTILWNGPLGLYEKGAIGGTEILAKQIAGSGAFSIVGGGDTVAAIEYLNLNDKFGFVSIGGGAMLTLLELGTTPAIEALE